MVKFAVQHRWVKDIILMKKEETIRVGISVGDLNGIGSEIILKTSE